MAFIDCVSVRGRMLVLWLKWIEGLGERFERMVGLYIQQIIDAPENYHYGKAPYKEVSTEVFPYVIVYKINKRKKAIFISAIYNTKRNPKYKYRKLQGSLLR